MTASLRAVASGGELFGLGPLERFRAIIDSDGFDARFRAEPLMFELADPIYGYGCGVEGCDRSARSESGWCRRHGDERRVALAAGVGDAAWKAAAVPLPSRDDVAADGRRAPCRFCPDRDAVGGSGLCLRHLGLLRRARQASGAGFDEEAWDAVQHSLPGAGSCSVYGCVARATLQPALCQGHRAAWHRAGCPEGSDWARWLATALARQGPGAVSLAGLPVLLEAEIRYGLWVHANSRAPARWLPMLLRTLVRSCRQARAMSLLDLEHRDRKWTPQRHAVNRIVEEMLKDVRAVHHSRAETKQLGYIDTAYWGFKFLDRRSPFDLSAISQRWLRDLGWDFMAYVLDGPRRPRRQGSFEATRRSLVCFSAYLAEYDPDRGAHPGVLNAATARGFVADFTRRAEHREPVLGMFNVAGSPSRATPTTYALSMNALRRVMRWALESGAAEAIGLPRDFIVAVPPGGALSLKNPRPFSDEVLRALSDPANIAFLAEMDPNDSGLADIWSIQVRCGRRISEVVQLRLDCVSEHLGRTWMWVDMTKVGKLDYAIQIPRDVYDLVVGRQAKTVEEFRLKHGVEPTPAQRRTIALFPSGRANPSFERSVSTSWFTGSFKAWLESEHIRLPGHTTHQARHTLATRLVGAGASMTHVKQVLGHISERMSDSYVLIAGSQVEPFLQQVWVSGPGAATPGRVVLTPTAAEKATAQRLMVDLAAVPTEHGLCTFKPVVGGHDCPFDRQCHTCEHFVLTGADYGYWKRQEQRWTAMAEGAPNQGARDYIYQVFDKSSQALAGLEKALCALGLLDTATQLDLRSPSQDFFDPIWRQGWHTDDLMRLGDSTHPAGDAVPGAADLTAGVDEEEGP